MIQRDVKDTHIEFTNNFCRHFNDEIPLHLVIKNYIHSTWYQTYFMSVYKAKG